MLAALAEGGVMLAALAEGRAILARSLRSRKMDSLRKEDEMLTLGLNSPTMAS